MSAADRRSNASFLETKRPRLHSEQAQQPDGDDAQRHQDLDHRQAAMTAATDRDSSHRQTPPVAL
jgi:hypothetical protein